MKTIKICIVEDIQTTYDNYKQMISEVIESGELDQRFTLMELPCAGSISYHDFEAKIKDEQPDIIFLDYDLLWTNGRYDAPNVIQSVIRYYSKLNYPPVIVLNTQRKEKVKLIGSLLNFSNQRNEFPKEFLMSLTAEEFQNEIASLVSLLNYSLEIIIKNDLCYQWVPGMTAYIYPSLDDFESIPFTIDYFSVTNWLNSEHRHTELKLSKKNLLCVAATTAYRGKSKLGVILYLDEKDEIKKVIFTFEKKEQIDEYVNSDEAFTAFRRKGSTWCNTRYFKCAVIRDRITFKSSYQSIRNRYFTDKDIELTACSCSEDNHPIYSLLTSLKS